MAQFLQTSVSASHTHKHNLCGHILNMEAFSSTLLDEICRFVNELLVQEVWSVSAIRNQQDVILQKNIDYNIEQKYTHTLSLMRYWFAVLGVKKKNDEEKNACVWLSKIHFSAQFIRRW